jgi:hypothetical protein
MSALEAGVLVACAYETAALVSRKRIDPISYLCWRHKWLTPVILTGLGTHLVFGHPPALQESPREQ